MSERLASSTTFGPEPEGDTDEQIIDWLRDEIEGFSNRGVLYSKGGYSWSPRGLPYAIFVNGKAAPMAAFTLESYEHVSESVRDLAMLTLAAVREYRLTIEDDVDVIWRGDGIRLDWKDNKVLLHVRLCFQPSASWLFKGDNV